MILGLLLRNSVVSAVGKIKTAVEARTGKIGMAIGRGFDRGR
ncbi:hypothetical protein J2T08_002077 [Neorhizobium galegae]|nr:hypothetical protein [Neorhizobium galegae]MDQ0134159.1 hypothetical protein [Neorhizobium galegae]